MGTGVIAGIREVFGGCVSMDILVIGGTKFFGIPMINALINQGHNITVATRGNTAGIFGDKASYVTVDRTNSENMKEVFVGKRYDVIIDKIAYSSNDLKYALDVLECGKFIHMSTMAVYEDKHPNLMESDFDPTQGPVIWCNRKDFPYGEIKRQAENALFQAYPNCKAIAVRYPYVIGKDDYTNRLLFYIEHTMKGQPMYIDNLDCQMGFIDSNEAGEFLAHLVNVDFAGPINGCNTGTVSMKEIIEYVEEKCGVKAVLTPEGDKAPYKSTPEYSINVDLAKKLGYEFSDVRSWIWELVDYYIDLVKDDK